MKATFSFNGKKYIYKIDGKQVRTSQRSTPYEYVAVRLRNGEFVKILACGQYKTCEQEAAGRLESIRRRKVEMSYLRGELTFSQYVAGVGYNNAMIKSFWTEYVAQEGLENILKRKQEVIDREMEYSEVILKFEQE